MLNYHEIVTFAADRQAAYFADAEQRWLVEQVTVGQLHPVRVWLGQQLIAWGERLAHRPLRHRRVDRLGCTPAL